MIKAGTGIEQRTGRGDDVARADAQQRGAADRGLTQGAAVAQCLFHGREMPALTRLAAEEILSQAAFATIAVADRQRNGFIVVQRDRQARAK